MKYRRFLRFVQKQFIKRPFASLTVLLFIVYFVAIFVIMFSDEINFHRAHAMMLPAFLGELGVVEGRSLVTEFSIMAGLLVSIAFLSVITAKITTVFIDFVMRGGSIVKKAHMSDHIIICGWNFQGDGIVRELIQSDMKPRRDIVILADLESRPLQDERVEFIQGDPTQDEDLIHAGVKKATSVIVLSDLSKKSNEADAEALMIVLAVESLHREVHTTVQILNSMNRVHLERAHADEIICLDQTGGHLAVASALNHGVSSVVDELLTFNVGSELYRYDRQLPDKLVGKEFCEVLQALAKKRMILLGVETEYTEELERSLPEDALHEVDEGNRAIIVNPQGEYKLRQGDALFLVAESEPTDL